MDFSRSLPKYSSPLGSFPDYSLPGASALTSVLGWVITQNGGFSLILASNLSSSLTIDDISQITSRSHTSLTNIGTLTHAQIDSYLDQAVKVASSPVFAGMTLTGFSGFVKATAGVLSAAALTDADIPNDITLTDITQITNRSHTSLSDIGTLTHATIDSYLDQAVKVASSPRFSALGIGTAPSYPLHIVDAMTSLTEDYSAMIDLDISGTANANVTHRGLEVNVDSTFTGTQSTGFRQTIHGIRSIVTSSGQPYNMWALRGDISYTGSNTITTVRGATTTATLSGAGTIGSASGYYGALSASAGTITEGHGLLSAVGTTGGTITDAMGVRALIQQVTGTITTGYLFYGSYSGTVGTKWGIYLTGETNNYLSGSLLIGSTTSLTTLAKGLVLGAGTAPTAVLANGVGLWCEDIAGGAGKSGLHMMSESGTEKLIVAGVIYKTTTGDPSQVHEGLLEINTFDNKVKMYADGGWVELGTW